MSYKNFFFVQKNSQIESNKSMDVRIQKIVDRIDYQVERIDWIENGYYYFHHIMFFTNKNYEEWAIIFADDSSALKRMIEKYKEATGIEFEPKSIKKDMLVEEEGKFISINLDIGNDQYKDIGMYCCYNGEKTDYITLNFSGGFDGTVGRSVENAYDTGKYLLDKSVF